MLIEYHRRVGLQIEYHRSGFVDRVPSEQVADRVTPEWVCRYYQSGFVDRVPPGWVCR